MAKVKRIIHKVERQQETGLDNQFWPVVVALCVLTSFIFGAILTLFRGPTLWFSLMLLPIGLATTIIVLGNISHQKVRRSLQFAIIVSLIFHVGLIISAYRVEIFGAWVTANRSRARTTQENVVRVPVQTEQQVWNQVNQTETPEIVVEQPEREEVEEPVEVERPQPTPVEQQQPEVQPNQVERAENAPSSPRFSEQQSQLSRSEQELRVQTSTAATAAANSSATASAAASEANPTQVTRQQSASSAERQTTESPTQQSQQATESPQRREVAQARAEPTPEPRREVTRRENPRPEVQLQAATSAQATTRTTTSATEINPQTAANERTEINRTRTQPTLERPDRSAELPLEQQPNVAQTPQPRPTRQSAESTPSTTSPSTTAPNEVASASRRQANTTPTTSTNAAQVTNDSSATAAATDSAQAVARSSVSRQRSVTNDAPRVTAQPVESPSAANQALASRTDVASQVPQATSANDLAQAETPTQRRRTSSELLPSAQTETVESNRQTAPTSATEIAANQSSAQVVRQPTQNPQASREQTALPETTTSLANQIPRVSPRANPSSTQPSVETNQSTQQPRRAVATSQSAQSPTVAESPTNSTANSGSQLTLDPAQPFSVTRASGGIAGVGRSRNLDRDAPASERPAVSPSNSMSRAETTTTETGFAFQPSQPSQVRHSNAGELVPSASVASVPEQGTRIPASTQTGTVTAQASATTVESRSPSEVGEISALRGSSEIDFGPPKIVANELDGRGAGGGQAQPTAEMNQNPATETDRGSLANSIAANTNAALPAAPEELGNTGAVTALDAPNSNALARADATGEAALDGGPTRTELTGPAELQSRAPDSGSLAMRRSEAADAIAAEADPGGGDDDEDEEERERRRRLAAAGGATIGSAIDVASADPSNNSGSIATDTGAEVTDGAEAGDASLVARSTNSGSQGSANVARESLDAVASGGGEAMASRLERADPADGLEGSMLAGGGNDSSRRRAPPAGISGNVSVAELASNPEAGTPGSSASADDLSPAESGTSRIAGSAEGVIRSTIGALTTQVAGPSIIALPPVVLGPNGQQREPGEGELAEGSGAPAGSEQRRAGGAGLTPSTAVEVDLAGVGDGNTGEGPDASSPLEAGLSPSGNAGLQRARRASSGATQVNVAADDGPGGLDDVAGPRPGINDRRARIDTGPTQSVAETRFIRNDAGGRLSFTPSVSIPADAFKGRRPPSGRRGAPQTEEAIELGLAFLARHQQPEGNWKLETFGTGIGDDADETPIFRSDTAATGLALLAFQGAGYNHIEYKYAEVVNGGIRWLVANQDEEGCLYAISDDESNKYCRLYSHGIAALALCEAYGMTQDPNLKEPAQRAIDYIVASQDTSRGGWRYTPGRSSDTSVSGWMMMAMKSGQLAGLDVPEETYQLIDRWLDRAQVIDEPHKYVYNPYADNSPERRHGKEASRSMTAVGLLMRLYSGWDRELDAMSRGSDYLLEQLPGDGNSIERDTYYWYYATQVLRHMGGEQWRRWNEKLHPLLISTQIKEPTRSGGGGLIGNDEVVEDYSLVGSWDPLDPVPDAWGITGGRIYVTALNLLSLEVDYRLLPLYQDTVD